MQGYKVKFENISIGSHEYQVRSLKNLQEFYDPDKIAEQLGISSASWSLFGVVWPSEIVLADHMISQPIEGLRVLEIGCGIALASLVACFRGADITATDYHPLAQAFLQENTALNQLPDINFTFGDWRKPNSFVGEFDLIIGSDLLYEPDHPQVLANFINCLASKKVEIILVDPGRKQTARFTKHMAQLGYSCHSKKVTNQLALEKPYKGNILTYKRASSLINPIHL